jgi:hypothetical protein
VTTHDRSLSAARIELEGSVACDALALGQLRLRGRLAAPDGRAAIVDIELGGTAPPWPLALDGATLEFAMPPARGVVLRSAGREWSLPDATLFMHIDFGAESATAIAPQPVPWRKRLFWRVLLALLRTRPGRRWLTRRYGA